MSLVKCVPLDVVEASRSPGDLTQTSRYLLSFSVPFTTKQRGAGLAIDGKVPGNRRDFVFCGSIRRGAVKETMALGLFSGRSLRVVARRWRSKKHASAHRASLRISLLEFFPEPCTCRVCGHRTRGAFRNESDARRGLASGVVRHPSRRSSICVFSRHFAI